MMIVNPVYDEEAPIELEEKSPGANNNVPGAEKQASDQRAAGDFTVQVGDVVVTEVNPSNGEVLNGVASTSNASTDSTWINKAKEKLITEPAVTTFGSHNKRKIILILAVSVIVAILVVLLTYFLYTHFHKQSGSNTAQPSVSGALKGKELFSQVRFGGVNDTVGHVQVNYKNAWISICSSSWGLNETRVVCSQLKKGTGKDLSYAEYEVKDPTDSIDLSRLKCLGTENELSECKLGEKYQSSGSCPTNRRISVGCGPSPSTSTLPSTRTNKPSPSIEPSQPSSTSHTTTPSTTGSGLEIRLSGTDEPYAGVLLVKHEDVWGTVCGDSWGPSETLVVCRQIRNSNYSSNNSPDTSSPAVNEQVVWLHNVTCTGEERNLGLCSISGWNVSLSTCPHTRDVTVTCPSNDSTTVPESTTTTTPTTTPTTTTPTTTPTRPPAAWHNVSVSILYGKTPNEGLVVLHWLNRNFTMCDYGWTRTAAQVVCRMNGYPEVINPSFSHLIDFEDGDYSVDDLELFDKDFRCKGDEHTLGVCGLVVDEQCTNHFQDVKVVCGPVPSTTAAASPSTTPTSTTTTTTTTTTTVRPLEPTTPSSHNRAILEEVPIRLRKGAEDSSRGRLEVKYNGTWGTVCNDHWKEENAIVVCRQLNFRGMREGEILTERDGIFRGHEDQPIWLNNVNCVGHEEYLTQCEHELVVEGHCFHREDIMMSCIPPYKNGDIKLNPGPEAGRLEFFWEGEWGAVCDEGWDRTDAIVACHQLGFSNVSSHSIEPFDIDGEKPDFLLSELHCQSNASRLLDCPHDPIGETGCAEPSLLNWWYGNKRIFLNCSSQLSEPRTEKVTAIRLVHGAEDENIGVLQYTVDGNWGTLCKTSWTNQSADVACKQLGYPGVLQYNLNITALRNISRASVTVPFHGKDYQCADTDTSIDECQHWRFSTGCQRYRDEVAIACQPRFQDNTVRLIGGNTTLEGIVQVYIQGTWGTVCDNGDWTATNKEYICTQLFGPKSSPSGSPATLTVDGPILHYIAGGFNCSVALGTPTSPFNQCSYNSNSDYLAGCSVSAQVKCIV